MIRKKFIQPREHPSRSSRLLGSTSSGTKWIFPDNIPSEYDWVSDEVLGTPSKVSLSYLEKLKEAKVVIRTSEEGKYELVVPNIEERICYSNRSLETESNWLWVLDTFFTKVGGKISFSNFQIEILQECKCAPSQLHPNSWSIIRSFELVCDFLGFQLSSKVFFYLFKLTIQKMFNGRTFLSFRAFPGCRIFSLFEDSYHDFKEMYFKIRPLPGVTLFYLGVEKKKRFHIYWNYNASSSRPSLDDLMKMVGGLEAVAAMRRRL
ncbi:hypothetical protein PIB30_005928 [Stylosanthes scabra]|uniref:Transposase (putative) gypsy type domain-containing protein n=1 Tax=Stylosanthes scabra TaxID=79078 RepID=A0ABU6R4K7_9FABA|nr:hypothetical protein [Stylosanthes scabra]